MARNAHIDHFRSTRARVDEVVTECLPGWIGKQFDRDEPAREGMLLLTNERLVFFRKGWLGEVFQAIELSEITAVWDESTLGRRILKVRAGSLSFEFRTFAATEAVSGLLEALEAKRRDLSRSDLSPTSAAGLVAQTSPSSLRSTESGHVGRGIGRAAGFLVSCFIGALLLATIQNLGGAASLPGLALFGTVMAVAAFAFVRPQAKIFSLFLVGTRTRASVILVFAAMGLLPVPPASDRPARVRDDAVAAPRPATSQSAEAARQVLPPAATSLPSTQSATSQSAEVARQTLPRAGASLPAVSPGPERPGSMRQPVALCSLLLPVGINAGDIWRPSNAVPGGWTCSGSGRWVDFGPPGLGNNPTNVTYFIFGGGPQQLDRIVLKLNLFNQSVTPDGKDRLVRASELVARHFGVDIPANLIEIIRRQQPRTLTQPPAGPRRVLASATQGDFVIEIGVEQSRITTLVVVFRNQRETGIWPL